MAQVLMGKHEASHESIVRPLVLTTWHAAAGWGGSTELLWLTAIEIIPFAPPPRVANPL